MGLLNKFLDMRNKARDSQDLSSISEFWNWWIETLAETFPNSLLYSITGKRDATIVTFRNGDFIIDGRPMDILPNGECASLPTELASRDVLLLIDRKSVFLRSRRYPAASRHRLKTMMDLQLEHEMPFARSEILTDTRIAFRFTASTEVHVEQAVAKTEQVEAAIDMLCKAGLRTVAVDVADEEGAPSGFRLPAPACASPRLSPVVLLNRALASSALVLLAIVAGLASLSLDRRIENLESRIAVIEPYAREVLRMQQTGHEFVQAATQIHAEASNPASFAKTFETVAALLPDGSWLEAFNYRDQTVSLIGASTSPDTLIALMESSPLVSTARFTAPLVTDNRLQADRFQIELTLAEPEHLVAEAPDMGH